MTDRRVGSKVANWANQDKVTGIKRDSGPYIGIVKNNSDPVRSGRLQIYIPDFGGVETDPGHWITVSYANPYMGAARISAIAGPKTTDNTFKTVNHSYGMWFTPPDIGNQVLVTFVNGDINRGYWFACIMPDLSHWAIPGQAGAQNLETPIDSNLAQALTNPPYPSVEFNETNPTLQQNWNNFLQINKVVHEDQVKILLNQDLEDDKVRGVISSSSQRESPSRVFGISTPGQDGSTTDQVTGQVTTRKGGHVFVMDDGNPAVAGADSLIRLRSAGGHQILMNDTKDVIYLANATGNVWMEFTGDGKVYFYSKSDLTFRTQGSFNLHADKDINMDAANGSINFRSAQNFNQQASAININASSSLEMYGQKVGLGSGSTLDISAATSGGFLAGANLTFYGSILYLNTNKPPQVSAPTNIPINSYPDVIPKLFGPYTKWQATGTVPSTIPINIPTHEPFTFAHPTGPSQGRMSKTSGSSQSTPPSVNSDVPGSTLTQPGPINADSAGVDPKRILAINNPNLIDQPDETDGLGILTATQLTALKAQIAKSESNFDYQSVNSLYYMGKYQFGYQALITFGYASSNTTSNYQLVTDTTQTYWAGKNGITNVALWLSSADVQEQAMNELLQQNYTILTQKSDLNGNPIIDDSSAPADVAGKLAICHLLGAGACVKWTNGQNSGADANGVTGTTYYNLGVYSIDVIAPYLDSLPPTQTI